MKLSEYKTISFERRGKVLYLTFNQPDTLNSFHGESHTELSHIFYDVVEDPESEIIVVTGAGRAFSAGGDLSTCSGCTTIRKSSIVACVKPNALSWACWNVTNLSSVRSMAMLLVWAQPSPCSAT